MTTTLAAPAVTSGLVAARFREANGLNVEVIGGAIMLPVRDVAGIRVLRPLATQVHAELDEQRLRTPIIEYPRAEALMFLVNAPTQTARWDHSFYRHFIARTPAGIRITLPEGADRIRNWLVAPEGDQRADFDVIAEIAVRAAEGRQRRG